MSAPTPDAPPTPAPDAPEGNPPADGAPEPSDLGDAGKKAIDAMKAERDTERRERARLAKELQEFKDRDLSELDRAKKAAEESAAELAEIRRQNTLLAKGIPADLIPPANASADDLAAYADRLLDWRNAGVQVPAGPPQPRPDRAQGAQPQDPGLSEDAEYAQYAAKYFTNNR